MLSNRLWDCVDYFARANEYAGKRADAAVSELCVYERLAVQKDCASLQLGSRVRDKVFAACYSPSLAGLHAGCSSSMFLNQSMPHIVPRFPRAAANFAYYFPHAHTDH